MGYRIPAMKEKDIESRYVLGMRVDATSYDRLVRKAMTWAHKGDSRYVCVGTVHMVMEAYDDPIYRGIVNSADCVTPDGMPLVWALRLLGVKGAERVYGPELMPRLLEQAAKEGIPVGFYGGRPDVLERLLSKAKERYPSLKIAYAYSPPFRKLTKEEDEAIVKAINESGARILFVGLGCPKQERWMGEHKGRVRAVMLGVGAAFDFFAGVKPKAPRWMQQMGLEWLFRLMTEPRRLWRRYFRHNPRFVILFLLQLAGIRRFNP